MTALWIALVLAVIDGDTLRVQVQLWPGQTLETMVRVDGIDTPEVHGKCAYEKRRALEARQAVVDLVAGKPVALYHPSQDKYGRWLASVVTFDGRDIAASLLKQDLARLYHGGTRGGWCD